MGYTNKVSILFLSTILFLASCGGEENVVETPSAYSFERDGASSVSYTGQTQRISMLAELSAYAKSGTDMELNEQTMLDMFKNENSPFSQTDLNQEGDSRKQIASKLYGQGDGLTPNDGGATQQYYSDIIGETARISSLNTDQATNGSAGTLTTGSSTYLVDEKGFEPAQLLEKGLMGALLFHQGTNVYLGADKLSVSGTELVSEKVYTSLEHHFDEAYGYFDLPTDMSNFNSAGAAGDLKFWAKYAYLRNGEDGIGYDIVQRIHEAFRTARACISAAYDLDGQEYDCTYNEAIDIIKTEWELLIAANVVHYINAAQSDLTNQANVSHALSECIGFLQGLRYANAGTSLMSSADIDEIEMLIGDNLWEVNPANLTSVKNKIAEKYTKLESVKDKL